MKTGLIAVLVSTCCIATGAAMAQQIQMTDHAVHQVSATNTAATEPGQGAFAAIAEIVALLRADPGTDWSRVDINALREHLVDMNELTLNAQVATATEGRRLVFRVSGEGRTGRAIRNMVPAHAPVLVSEVRLDAEAQPTDDGAVLTVTAATQEEAQQMAALGFFGIMALGAHHQEHHMQMARGDGAVHDAHGN